MKMKVNIFESNKKSFNDFLFLPLMFIKVSEVVLRERKSKFL